MTGQGLHFGVHPFALRNEFPKANNPNLDLAA
jgi:hypothetical protein